MLLDEFTALGRSRSSPRPSVYLPGYNVRVVLVIQTRSQLREVYGVNAAETMLRNLAARVVFAPTSTPTRARSPMSSATITVKTRSVSKPAFDLFGKAQRSRSVSVSEQRRPLLLPQEVQAMRSDEAIVFYEGIRPVRCKKIRYFSDRRFKRLIGPPPPYASPALASGEVAPVAPSASPETLRLRPDSPPATATATTPKPPRATPPAPRHPA